MKSLFSRSYTFSFFTKKKTCAKRKKDLFL
jgi:hypothetical protein